MTIPVNYFMEWREHIVLSRNANPWTYTFRARGFCGSDYGDFGVEPFNAKLQLRLYEGAPGAPLLTVITGGSNSRLEGNRWSITALISNADLQALPAPDELGAPLILHYDLLASTPRGESVSHYGRATIRTGVTR